MGLAGWTGANGRLSCTSHVISNDIQDAAPEEMTSTSDFKNPDEYHRRNVPETDPGNVPER